MKFYIIPKDDQKLGVPNSSGTINLTDLSNFDFVRLRSPEQLIQEAAELVRKQLAIKASARVLEDADELLSQPIKLGI